MANRNFVFEISLSVLNHLGRNLYRRFTTILGEAVSNSWDADAYNVSINIDRESNNLIIKDDGSGMTSTDFQKKFLRIGYSKRKNGKDKSQKGRPFIGRKGIGKLALLSCADKITVISKTKNGSYIGGTINNSKLDVAIKDDLHTGKYTLGNFNENEVSSYTAKHKQGTIIKFQNLKGSVRNTDDYLKRILALYFRFSLIDHNFNIYLNDDLVTYKNLDSLAKKTQFLWVINNFQDPYIKQFRKKKEWAFKKRENIQKNGPMQIEGFIASVNKPRDLTIETLEERVTVDLFVNGRLRDKNILRHIPTSRIVENYLYGQIHFNELDDDIDRFTSSREGIVADDPKYKDFLELFKKVLSKVVSEWDTFRREERQDGDLENKTITPQERKAEELSNIVTHEFDLPDDPVKRAKTEKWIEEIKSKVEILSYIRCFTLENLFRKFIKESPIKLDNNAMKQVKKFRKEEQSAKEAGNVNIGIRLREDNDLNYLGLHDLSRLVDPEGGSGRMLKDAKAYKPIRNALMHAATLTEPARTRLKTIYDNMKGRLEELFKQ